MITITGISHQDLEQRLLHISRTDLAQTVEQVIFNVVHVWRAWILHIHILYILQLMANGHIYDAGGLLYVV